MSQVSQADILSIALMLIFSVAATRNLLTLFNSTMPHKRPFHIVSLLHVPIVFICFYFGWLYARLNLPDILPPIVQSSVFRLPQVGVAVFLLFVPDLMRSLFKYQDEASAAELSLVTQKASDNERERLYEQMKAQYAHQQSIVNELRKRIIDNVGHELRTPLAIVLGYLQMISEGYFGELPDGVLDPLGRVNEQSRRMKIVVDRMIVMLRQPHPETFDIGDVVNSVAFSGDVFLTTRQSAETVEVSTSGDRLAIEGDMVMIKTAVYELVNNGIKFREGDGGVDVSWWERNQDVFVSVRDDGVGIERKHHQRIFEPMIQLDMGTARRFEGAGMGLAVVQQVADAHDGYVEIVSDPNGGGSTFTMVLPKHFRGDG